MGEFEVDAVILAPIATVWKRLADIGNINEWNPGVRDSYVTSVSEIPMGEGATRHCDIGLKTDYVDEEVVTFIPEQAITFRITGTSVPIAKGDIRFTLSKEKANRTKVTCSPLYKLKYGCVGEMLDLLMVKRQYRSGMKDLLSGLKADVEGKKQ